MPVLLELEGKRYEVPDEVAHFIVDMYKRIRALQGALDYYEGKEAALSSIAAQRALWDAEPANRVPA